MIKTIRTNISHLDYIKEEEIIMQTYPTTKRDFQSSEKKEEKQNDRMEVKGGKIIIIGIVAIAVSVLTNIKKIIKVIGNMLSWSLVKDKKSKNEPYYTEKDRDMIELIYHLSEIYKNTEQYMKN